MKISYLTIFYILGRYLSQGQFDKRSRKSKFPSIYGSKVPKTISFPSVYDPSAFKTIFDKDPLILIDRSILFFKEISIFVFSSISLTSRSVSNDDKNSWQLSLRKLLERLGPLSVKFGQVLSSRPDLIPVGICRELRVYSCHLIAAFIIDLIRFSPIF